MTKAVLLPLGFLFLLAAASPAQTNSAADMAVNRAVIDQANTILLRQKLEDARGAASRGDLTGAAKLYEDAKTLVDEIGSGIDAETAQAISGLAASRLELARRARHDGDLHEADTQVMRVLKVDPHNAAALAFKKENDQIIAAMKGRMPSASTVEQIPLVANDKTAAGTLVQDGKLLYEMGKFEEAETKLKQALKLDPDNEGAFYYLNLVKQAYYAREEHNRTTEAQDKMVQVQKQWSPTTGIGTPWVNPTGDGLLKPNPYATDVNKAVHTSPGREMIYDKLNRLRPPPISWPDGLPLKEVIHWMNEQSKLCDPDKKGINFIFNPNVEGGAGNAAAAGQMNPTTGMIEPSAAGATVDPSTINIALVMNDVSFHDALDALLMVADHPVKYSVEDYAVVISAKPAGPESPMLEMRVFKVDPNTFYEGLLNVSMNNAFNANNNSSGNGNSGNGNSGNSGNNNNNNNNNGDSGGGNSGGANVPTVSVVNGGGGGRRGNGGNGGGATATVGGLNYINTTPANKVEINTAVQDFFKAVGVDLTAVGRSVAFNDRLGLLFVKASPSELDVIERTIQTLNQVAPQVHIKARFIEVEQDDNTALGFDWYLGNFINGSVIASGGSAPSLTVPQSAANPLGAFPGSTAASLVPASANDQLLTSGLRDSAPALATVTGILTDPNFRVVLHALEQRTGVEQLAEPEAVTTSGRQTQMRATDIKFIVTGYNFSGGGGGLNIGGGGGF
jgi:hypothetical protein